jgi:rSAM/selenodomain-associated transferase 1
MTKNLLIIFAKNPIKGKVKTRLAKVIGNEKALAIYEFLLDHIQQEIRQLAVDIEVHYSHFIDRDDDWQHDRLEKKLQIKGDLGEKMGHAFQQGFANGYQHVIGIGTDIYDLNANDIQAGFDQLKKNPYCFGPANDGGYYLIGMTQYQPQIFQNKFWSTASVLKETLRDLPPENVTLLQEKMDVDTIEDLKQIKELSYIIK